MICARPIPFVGRQLLYQDRNGPIQAFVSSLGIYLPCTRRPRHRDGCEFRLRGRGAGRNEAR